MKTQNLITLVGKTPITIQHHLTDDPRAVKLVRVHGDELSAKECSLAWLAEQGGEFIDIENVTREVRFEWDSEWHSVDPNRMFTSNGIANSLQEQGSQPTPELLNAVEPLAQKISQLLQPASTVIAMHNNLDFNIRYYQAGGECIESADGVHQNTDMHPHDFVLVTARNDFDILKAANVNVVLLNDVVTDHSGSLSEHCMARGQRYFNIEAYRGHLQEQQRMLRVIMDYVNVPAS